MRTTEHSSRRQAGFWIGVGIVLLVVALTLPFVKRGKFL